MIFIKINNSPKQVLMGYVLPDLTHLLSYDSWHFERPHLCCLSVRIRFLTSVDAIAFSLNTPVKQSDIKEKQTNFSVFLCFLCYFATILDRREQENLLTANGRKYTM